MANENICKNKMMAQSIIEALIMNMRAGTQRFALESVLIWIRDNVTDEIPDDPEKRKAMANEIQKELITCMSHEERKALAHNLLKGMEEEP